jgi:hypothetical protein
MKKLMMINDFLLSDVEKIAAHADLMVANFPRKSLQFK